MQRLLVLPYEHTTNFNSPHRAGLSGDCTRCSAILVATNLSPYIF